jgi:tetratricopeptide (TPR) repeat protein
VTIDEVLKSPAAARAKASELLADDTISPTDRRNALWTLGKSLLEANQIADACHVLHLAADEALGDHKIRALIQGTLATCLAKQGDIAAAHEALNYAETYLDGANLGRIVNQRGLIHFELGDFPVAERHFESALALLRTGGDVEAETRTLFNLATIASLQGRMVQAEHRFREVRELAIETGQNLLLAGIEGNLGYTVARRADFPLALTHFERARAMFAEMGEVGLSVANLEFDYSEVLLKLGLNVEAAEAARRSLKSSHAGGNVAQSAQARLQLAIAMFALGDRETARAELDHASDDFQRAELVGWFLRCEYFKAQFATGDGKSSATELETIAERLLSHGWIGESDEVLVSAALRAIEAGENELADRLLARLEKATPQTDSQSARPEMVYAIALRHLVDGRVDRARRTLRIALRTLSEQISVLGSRELQAGVAGRTSVFGDLAVRLALLRGQPAELLQLSEQLRALSLTPTRARPEMSTELHQALGDWRNVQAELDAARMSGAASESIGALTICFRTHEQTLQQLARRQAALPGAKVNNLNVKALRASLRDRVLIEYIASEGSLSAVVVDSARCRLVHLGTMDAVRSAIEAQRSAFRRITTGRIGRTSIHDLLREGFQFSQILHDRLVHPLRLRSKISELIIVPTGPLHGVLWSAIPSIATTPVTVTPSTTLWMAENSSTHEKTRGSVGLIALPGLERAASEVASVAAAYQRGDWVTVATDTTVAGVLHLLRSHDVVHLAGHGSFRSDNPWFSSIRASDGAVSVFDIEGLDRVPRLVIVAACEAGASHVLAGDELVGTTAALLGVGVGGVIAASFPVPDHTAEVVMIDLHAALALGESSAESMLTARQQAKERGNPIEIATALVFQHFGASFALFQSRL